MTIDSVTELGKRLGHRFGDPTLATAALTHPSASGESNQRLEFLGDAVIALAIAEWLYEHEPGLEEGDLTRMRASLVNRDSLAALARDLDLGALLELGGGERRSGGFQRRSILEDAFEAVIGAVFLDGGYASARAVVHHVFAARLDALPDPESLKDPKTRLQENLQARGLGLPDYTVLAVGGPEHARLFEAECRVAALSLVGRGSGASKRRAEQAAAAVILAQLDA